MKNRNVELSVGGMTCATCSRRVEKSLAKLSGVSASVNYATGEAFIEVSSSVKDEDLISAIEKTGYTASLTGHAIEPYGEIEFRNRLLATAIVTIPLMVISMSTSLQFRGWQWVAAFVSFPIATWGAWPFHLATVRNLKQKAVTMDTLISLGVVVSYSWSLWAILFTTAGDIGTRMQMSLFAISKTMNEPPIYFEVASSVTTLVLLGKYLEFRARNKSLLAIENLAKLNPKFATVIRDGIHLEVPIEEVVVGDVVEVFAGGQIPVDGVVIQGQGHVDNSLVTGESIPVRVSSGDQVIGATVVIDSSLLIKTSAVGKDSLLAGISRMVHQALASKAQVTKLVDRISEIFVPVVVGVAVLTVVGWLVAGSSLEFSLTAGIAVLVIACPCALGLATPTALLVGTGRGAQLGLLIRGASALEASKSLTTIFLDKTGTLTQGKMQVIEATFASQDFDQPAIWTAVAALERTSLHPAARSTYAYAMSQGGAVTDSAEVLSIAGSGVQGIIAGEKFAIGSVDWLGMPTGLLGQKVSEHFDKAHSVVVVHKSGEPIVVLALADSINPDTPKAIEELKRMNISPVILSGDHHKVVAQVAQSLGISNFQAGLSPSEKVDAVRNAQEQGEVVAMIGDGINDAAALARADLSIAMGDGTDVAASSADIVLLRSSMSAGVDAIRLSQATMHTIQLNLFWAFAYNVAAIPLAILGYLGPIVASGAMAFSSVFVVTNSLRLRKFRRLDH